MALADLLNEEGFNALDESTRPLYIKTDKDGAVSYNLHPAFVAERTALTGKNTELKTEKEKKAAELAAFQGIGMDAEKLKELAAKQQQLEDSKKSAEERATSQLESLKNSHKAEVEALKTNASGRETFLLGQLRNQMIDSVAALAIKEAGGEVEPLLPHVKQLMDIVEEGEGETKTLVTRIIDDKKAPRYVGAEYMSASQLVEEFKKKPAFQGLFKATGKGGSGAQQQNLRTISTARATDQMTATDKIAQGLANRSR